MGEVCVVGSFMMDIVVRTERRPGDGETVIGESVDFHLGGKGFNQAIAAARQGVTTSMIGRVGDDAFGDQFLAALAGEGIEATHVVKDPHLGTGTGLPVVDASGQNSIVVVPQANTGCRPQDIESATRLIERADVLLVQLELPLQTVRRALQIAKAAGVTTILNPAPMHASVADLAGLVDVIAPNESEAASIVGHATAALSGDDSLAAAVAEAVEAPAVVLTLGERGALVWDQGQVSHFTAHPVQAIDTVGAGDATCGVVAAALANGAQLADAVRLGTAAGALAVTVCGAEPSMPTAAAIAELLVAPVPAPTSTGAAP